MELTADQTRVIEEAEKKIVAALREVEEADLEVEAIEVYFREGRSVAEVEIILEGM